MTAWEIIEKVVAWSVPIGALLGSIVMFLKARKENKHSDIENLKEKTTAMEAMSQSNDKIFARNAQLTTELVDLRIEFDSLKKTVIEQGKKIKELQKKVDDYECLTAAWLNQMQTASVVPVTLDEAKARNCK